MKPKSLLALVAGIIGFAGEAKAAIVFQKLDLAYDRSGYLSFAYNPSTADISVSQTSNLDGGFSLSYSPPAPNDYYPLFGPPTFSARYDLNGGSKSNFAYGNNIYDTSLTQGFSVNGNGGGGSRGITISGGWSDDLSAGETVYVGLAEVMFTGNNPAYNGWAAFTGTGSGVRLDAVAFNTVLGSSITAGDTGSGSYSPSATLAVPEPSAVALLGLGAMGLVARRLVA
jgi:hypothetical protein